MRNATVCLCCVYRKCQKVLGKNMDLWENEVYRFKTIGQLKVRHTDVSHTEIKLAFDLERNIHIAGAYYVNVIIRDTLVSCVSKLLKFYMSKMWGEKTMFPLHLWSISVSLHRQGFFHFSIEQTDLLHLQRALRPFSKFPHCYSCDILFLL